MNLTEEKLHSINGVEGRMFAVTIRQDETPSTFCSQKWGASRPISGYGKGATIYVQLSFDDECKNGRNSFSITADITVPKSRKSSYGSRETIACGCLHDDIARVFPELRELIKWHLTSTDEPMHYVSNAVYLAGDRDHWGLRKGEHKPLLTKDGEMRWELQAITDIPDGLGVKISDTPTGREYIGAKTVPLFILEQRHTGNEPPATPILKWVQSCRIGEGKERQLDAARAAAVWLDATDEELMQEPDALRAALEARLPILQEQFKIDMVNVCGFIWERQA